MNCPEHLDTKIIIRKLGKHREMSYCPKCSKLVPNNNLGHEYRGWSEHG